MDTKVDEEVLNPQHYSNYRIEPAEYIMLNDMEFGRGNIIKYASRAGMKLYPNQTQMQSLKVVQTYIIQVHDSTHV